MLVMFSTDDNIKGHFMGNSFVGVSFYKKKQKKNMYTVCLCDDNVSNFIMHTFYIQFLRQLFSIYLL